MAGGPEAGGQKPSVASRWNPSSSNRDRPRLSAPDGPVLGEQGIDGVVADGRRQQARSASRLDSESKPSPGRRYRRMPEIATFRVVRFLGLNGLGAKRLGLW